MIKHLGALTGMMLIVAIACSSGLFQVLAIISAKAAGACTRKLET